MPETKMGKIQQESGTCTTQHFNKLTLLDEQVKKHMELLPMGFQDHTRNMKDFEVLYERHCEQKSRIKQLETSLEAEQAQVNILRNDNQNLRKMVVNMSALTEQEEEFISNKLLKQISGLKKEKGELLMQVEQEEEYMTNMLQKKLVQLQKEKIDLENVLEQEQERMVNHLQKQLDMYARRQNISPTTPRSLPSSPVMIESDLLTTATINTSDVPSSPGIMESLRAEVLYLKAKAAEMEKEYLKKHQQCVKYKQEIIQFRKRNNISIDDMDDGRLPRIFKNAITSPDNSQNCRSNSTSSQRSIASSVPSLCLDSVDQPFSPDSTISPQSITEICSPSMSTSTSCSFYKKDYNSSKRVSGVSFGLSSAPPQHPPQL